MTSRILVAATTLIVAYLSSGTAAPIIARRSVSSESNHLGRYKVMENFDTIGASYASPYAPDESSCAEFCEKDPYCAGFVYGDSTCWLKQSMEHGNRFKRAHNRASYIKKKDSLLELFPGYSVARGIDRWGGDLESMSKITLNACHEACQNKPECKGFIFKDGHECHLKKEWGSQAAYSNVVLFTKDSFKLIGSGNYTMFPGLDSVYEELRLIDNRKLTVEECAGECQNEKRCDGFVHYPNDDGRCFLKTYVKRNIEELTHRPEANTYLRKTEVPGLLPPDFVLMRGHDAPWNDIGGGEWPAATAEACAKACTSVTGCVAASWTLKEKCYLKNKLENIKTDTEVMLFIKNYENFVF